MDALIDPLRDAVARRAGLGWPRTQQAEAALEALAGSPDDGAAERVREIARRFGLDDTEARVLAVAALAEWPRPRTYFSGCSAVTTELPDPPSRSRWNSPVRRPRECRPTRAGRTVAAAPVRAGRARRYGCAAVAPARPHRSGRRIPRGQCVAAVVRLPDAPRHGGCAGRRHCPAGGCAAQRPALRLGARADGGVRDRDVCRGLPRPRRAVPGRRPRPARPLRRGAGRCARTAARVRARGDGPGAGGRRAHTGRPAHAGGRTRRGGEHRTVEPAVVDRTADHGVGATPRGDRAPRAVGARCSVRAAPTARSPRCRSRPSRSSRSGGMRG